MARDESPVNSNPDEGTTSPHHEDPVNSNPDEEEAIEESESSNSEDGITNSNHEDPVESNPDEEAAHIYYGQKMRKKGVPTISFGMGTSWLF